VEALLSAGDQVVARLTYRGTHQGSILGVAPTGRRVTYPGIAWFRLAGGRIVAAWIVGDTGRLLRELGALPDAPV
jgi:predicted ester cyclase